MTNVTNAPLMQASRQWATRPDDERFVSLIDMREHFENVRKCSTAVTINSRQLQAMPLDDNKGLMLEIAGADGAYAPTNWAFGQVAQLAEAPAGYLRTLPSPLVADCINYGLAFKREQEKVGALLYRNGGTPTLRAATGPTYGRIWNADIVRALIDRFGDGISGDTFRVPGEFGKQVDITKENTTLYGSDRDMFVFLADEKHRIELPNRRDGEAGSLARGFFVWNSEVGDKIFGVATFLFDYVCCNRIVWGPAEYKEIKIRHTSGAPERFVQEITPALLTYANSSTASITQAIENARAAKIGDEDAVSAFLAQRFGKRMVQSLQTAHKLEEGRQIETLWDATTAATAVARSITQQDSRVALERQAGDVLALASA